MEHRFADKVLRFYARTVERAGSADELAPDVHPPRPLPVDQRAALGLAGYEQPVREYQSGDTIHLFLYWTGGNVGRELVSDLELALVDKGGGAWKWAAVPGPTATAATGYVRQQVDLVVPPEAPSGEYVFALQPLAGGEALCFGRVALRQRERAVLTVADVTVTHPADTDFGDGVRLLGYDLEAEGLRPGGTVYLTLYWQAREPVERRYKVFTHLLGEVFNAGSGNFLWGQQDNEPLSGTRPTSTWRAGEVIVDSYAIPLEGQAPVGRYALEIGLYDPATGERLPVLDEGGQGVADHVVLDHVTVGSE